jgi:hypothetical protein
MVLRPQSTIVENLRQNPRREPQLGTSVENRAIALTL